MSELKSSINYNIPMHLSFFAEHSDERKLEILQNEIEIKLSATLKLQGLISKLLIDDEISAPLAEDYFSLLTDIGVGLTGARETYVFDCRKEKDQIRLKAEKVNNKNQEIVLDLSNHPTAEDKCIDLAEHISAVLSDPNTPQVIEEVLYNAVMETGRSESSEKFTISPKVIAERLCSKEVVK